MKTELSRKFSKKKIQISYITNIRSVGTELSHAGGRTDRETDMTKLIVAFRNLANATKK